MATQQEQVAHLRTTGGNVTAANIQEYQLANHMESGLVLNNDLKEDTGSTEQSPQQQTTPVTSSGQQLNTQQAVVTASPQYSSVPQEHNGGQITTTAHESSFPVKIIPQMTSTGQLQYVAAPVTNSHGYPAHLTGATMPAATATNPYSYQLQNAPSTPPITMINPSQPVLFSPPSSGPPTPSHYIPQGLFSPPPQPPILVGMGTAQTQQQQQISNLVTQQSNTEGKDSVNSSVTCPVVTTTNTKTTTSSSNEKTVSTSDTVQQQINTQAVATSTTTFNKHISGTYSATELPPRFQHGCWHCFTGYD